MVWLVSGRFIPVHFHTQYFSYPCTFIPMHFHTRKMYTVMCHKCVCVWFIHAIRADECGNYRTPCSYACICVCIRKQSCVCFILCEDSCRPTGIMFLWALLCQVLKVLIIVKIKLAAGTAERVLLGLHASAAWSGVTVLMNHRGYRV